jgi:O-antigen/teichoic acid export membrane protein
VRLPWGSGAGRLGRRTTLGVVDQVISSGTNFALNVLVVSSVSTDAYGTFALVYALYYIAWGAIQALVAQPLLVRHTDQLEGEPKPDDGGRQVYRLALGSGLELSLVGSAFLLLAALVVPDELVVPMVVLAVVLPGLLVQEVMRAVFLAEGRPSAAIAIDSAWAVAQLVLVGSLLASGTAQVPWLLLAWGVSGGVSALAAMLFDRLWPAVRGAARWLVGHRRLSLPFFGEIMTDLVAAQLVLIALGSLAGLDAVGTFRSAQLLFSPLAVMFMAGMRVGIPEAVRLLRTDPRRFRTGMVVAGAGITLVGVVWSLTVIGLPDALGERLLGESWSSASTILPQFSLFYVGAAAGLAALVGLRALAASRASFRARTTGSVLGLVLGALGAGRAGAGGAAIGLGIGVTVATTWVWLSFRSESRVAVDAAGTVGPGAEMPSPRVDP